MSGTAARLAAVVVLALVIFALVVFCRVVVPMALEAMIRGDHFGPAPHR